MLDAYVLRPLVDRKSVQLAPALTITAQVLPLPSWGWRRLVPILGWVSPRRSQDRRRHPRCSQAVVESDNRSMALNDEA
jgi:hypothetical protein